MERPKHKRPTQGDIARLAGVSTAVVSYVINGGPRPVSSAARHRVLTAIKELGYRPNASARALRTGDSGLIGVFAPGVVNPYHAELIQAITRHAHEAGMSTLLLTTHSSPEEDRELVATLIDRGVNGLIISPLDDPTVYATLATVLPTTVVNPGSAIPGCHSVGPDIRPAMRSLTQHLIDHGHTAVGLLMGPLDPWDPNDRQRGWSDALVDAGLDSQRIEVGPWSLRGGYVAMNRMLDRADAPTAVIAGSDLLAIGALRAMWERGMTAPRDIALASSDGTSTALYNSPRLTTLVQPLDEMARDGVRHVLDQPQTSDLNLYPMAMTIGESCGCRADSFGRGAPPTDYPSIEKG
ncbi:LacI family DNA-binding transcriptional regulator [Actinomyces radicidentis]|uniref:LacI family DNA-binding transcriptional regulator n=1 Tax=Actinomyces radicidentis TaxID=111015 RepID=UPI0026E0BE69|nr:LacI family DNA-binding transcriptional regulator [Actinomyces radicidentis]